jgi:Family of unknown function (DUF5906)
MNPFEAIAAIIDGAQPMARPVFDAAGKPSSAAAPFAHEPARKQGLVGEVCKSDITAESAVSHDGKESPVEPEMFRARSFGFDIDKLNEEFALVLMGSKAVVFLERPDALIEDQQRMLTIEAFNAWFANRFTEQRGNDGKVKVVTWARAWMQSSRRRQYSGVEFYPDPHNAEGTRGYLNLWAGFAVEPAAKSDPARYSIFRDHLLTNVCGGEEAKFRWVFGFAAHVMQHPRERLGVALVLRGKMGSGKTKVGEVFGSLIPRHYFLVDDPRYVTGNFNAHMAACLLLQADEAVWAGDKSAEGRLKGLITSPIQQIEAKGVDPIRLTNYVRLIMTSNEDWVVPAGKDERRFTVLDVSPYCAQNHQYFREMDEQLAAGGLAHLLGDLLAFDLNSVNLRQVLRTEALLEQKIRSLDSVESWWFERLQAGALLRHDGIWPSEIPIDPLYDDYINTSEKIGIRRKLEKSSWGDKLRKIVPDIDRRRRTVMTHDENGIKAPRRSWVYAMPDIDRARDHFEQVLGQKVDWPALDEPSSEADAPYEL